MKGKAGLVIGLAAGYVLGARAGRERYEQIKGQAQKVWNLTPVQNQVDRAKDFAKSAVAAVPVAVWDGAVKVTKAAAQKGSPSERVDAAKEAGKKSAADVKKATQKTADDLADKAAEALDEAEGVARGGA
jgi:hypothetical protein